MDGIIKKLHSANLAKYEKLIKKKIIFIKFYTQVGRTAEFFLSFKINIAARNFLK